MGRQIKRVPHVKQPIGETRGDNIPAWLLTVGAICWCAMIGIFVAEILKSFCK